MNDAIGTFNAIAKAIKSALYEKTVSTLAGTLILTWSINNYRFLITVFSSETPLKKFDIISNTLYSTTHCTYIGDFPFLSYNCKIFWDAAFWPVTSAVFLIFIYPWFGRKVFSFTLTSKNMSNEILIDKTNKTTLTQEEANSLRADIARSELDHENELSALNNKTANMSELIKKLETEKKNLTIERNELKKKVSSLKTTKKEEKNVIVDELSKDLLNVLSNSLTDEEREVLLYISNSINSIKFSIIKSYFGDRRHAVDLENEIQQLEDKGLVTGIGSEIFTLKSFQVTLDGKRYINKHNLTKK